MQTGPNATDPCLPQSLDRAWRRQCLNKLRIPGSKAGRYPFCGRIPSSNKDMPDSHPYGKAHTVRGERKLVGWVQFKDRKCVKSHPRAMAFLFIGKWVSDLEVGEPPWRPPRYPVVSPSLDRRSHLLIDTAFPVSSSFSPPQSSLNSRL